MSPRCEWLNVNCPKKIAGGCDILPKVEKLHQEQESVPLGSDEYWQVDSAIDTLAQQRCDLENKVGRVIDEQGLTPEERAQLNI